MLRVNWAVELGLCAVIIAHEIRHPSAHNPTEFLPEPLVLTRANNFASGVIANGSLTNIVSGFPHVSW